MAFIEFVAVNGRDFVMLGVLRQAVDARGNLLSAGEGMGALGERIHHPSAQEAVGVPPAADDKTVVKGNRFHQIVHTIHFLSRVGLVVLSLKK